MSEKIYNVDVPEENKLLRMKMPVFDFTKYSGKEINDLIDRMKSAMHVARGIGLSANQIGLPFRVFVGQIPAQHGRPKFYAIFNPEIEKSSEEVDAFEEGCLSAPGLYGDVKRPEEIVLRGFDKKGKPVKIKAWGLLARMFQHEVDHLNGTVFIDKATGLHKVDMSHGVPMADERWAEARD